MTSTLTLVPNSPDSHGWPIQHDLFEEGPTHPSQPKDKERFARFSRSFDLSVRARCDTAIVATLASRRDARDWDYIVSSTIKDLADSVGASAAHIGQRTLRSLEAQAHITRKGSGWTANLNGRAWFKFPGWVTTVGLSRNAITVLLGICSASYEDDYNRITISLGQLEKKLGMSRNTVSESLNELVNAGAIIKHRRRARGRHDYNLVNQYTVCFRKFVPKNRGTAKKMRFNDKTQRLVDLLMNDPTWLDELTKKAITRHYRNRLHDAVARHGDAYSAAELVEQVSGRGVAGVDHIWGVLVHRLNEIPTFEDRQLSRAWHAARLEEISPAQLELVEQQVRREEELFGYTQRPE